jgi:hypothetical protein
LSHSNATYQRRWGRTIAISALGVGRRSGATSTGDGQFLIKDLERPTSVPTHPRTDKLVA